MASDRDINLAIVGEDATKPATDGAARNFDKLQRKVDSFSSSKPSAEMRQFSKVIDSSMRDGESAFTSINRSIEETRTKITKLRTEFRSTGSSSVFGDLKGAEKDLKSLLAVAGEFGDAGEKAGTSFATKFGQSASAILPDLLSNPVGLAIGAGVVAVAAPIIGAGIAAAVASGVGLGFIGAGALIEKNNPAITAALSHLSGDAKSVFTSAASPLVAPFVAALDQIDQLVKSEGPELRKAFEAVAPAVGLISSGLSHITADLLPTLVKDAESFSTALKDPAVQSSVAGAERSFAALFNTIGNNPQLIADGFRAISDGVHIAGAAGNAFLTVVAGIDDKLRDAYDKWLKLTGQHPQPPQVPLANGGASNGFEQIRPNNVPLADWMAMKTGAAGAQQAFNGVAASLHLYAQAAQTAALGAMALDTSQLDVAISTNDFNSSVTNLISLLKTNKRSLNEHTAAGEADRGMILGIIAAQKSNIPLWEKQGLTVGQATAKFNTNLTSMEKQLAANGQLTPAMQKLIDKYLAVPANVHTNLTNNAAAASKEIEAYKTLIEKLPSGKTFTLRVVTSGDIHQAQSLARQTGQNIASSGFDNGWRPAVPALPGHGGITTPATRVDAHLNARLVSVLDGRVVAESVFNSQPAAQERHRQRVGVLR